MQVAAVMAMEGDDVPTTIAATGLATHLEDANADKTPYLPLP